MYFRQWVSDSYPMADYIIGIDLQAFNVIPKSHHVSQIRRVTDLDSNRH